MPHLFFRTPMFEVENIHYTLPVTAMLVSAPNMINEIINILFMKTLSGGGCTDTPPPLKYYTKDWRTPI